MNNKSDGAKKGWIKRKAKSQGITERLHKLYGLIGAMVVIIVFLIGYGVYQIYNYRNLGERFRTIERWKEKIEFVADDFMLLEKIENILREKAVDKMTGDEIMDVARVVLRFHQRYGDNIGLTASRILAMMDKESKFNPRAKSPAGALGLVQIMPYNFPRLLKDYYHLEGLSKKQLEELIYKPDVNLTCGLRYLMELQTGYVSDGKASENDYTMSHTRYCWSHESVEALDKSMSKNEPKASLNYANDIKQLMQEYKEKLRGGNEKR